VAHFTVCQAQKPELVWVYLLRGYALGQIGDSAAAEKDFDQALKLGPSDAARYVLYNNRGVMRVGRKETWAQGVEDLRRAAELRPEQYQPHDGLAQAYLQAFLPNKRLTEAGQEFDQALALAGRQVRAGELLPAALAGLHYSRAGLYLERADRQAAVRDLAEAARLVGNSGPLAARAEADRGRVLHLQERLTEALAAYDASLKADPGGVKVLRWRGEVLLAQRRYAEAAAAFDAYLERGGAPSAALYRQRGLARAELGRHAAAIDDLGRALEARPKPEELPSLYLSRGKEYLAINALQPALGDFEEALRLQPDSGNARLGCAHARVKLGQLKEGLADAERAVQGEPKDPRLWHGAARVYAQAATQVKAEPGMEESQARIREGYQERAVGLLRRALLLVPAGQRPAYWRDTMRNDPALTPLHRFPPFVRLAARLEEPDG
jgi:tetratricopeptide (TPR) repeat protein